MEAKKKILIVAFMVLGVLSFLFLFFQRLAPIPQKPTQAPPEKPTLPQKPTESEKFPQKEIPSFSGKVVDKGDNFIIILKGENEKIKVILNPETKVFKIIYPKGASQRFTTQRVEISPDEIKKGDTIFVKTSEKREVISHVEYIEVL